MLFIVLDHPGSGQLGCCGSPFGTPSSGTLAASSLRCNNMHTAASCITGQPNQELPPAKRRLIFRAVLRGLARGEAAAEGINPPGGGGLGCARRHSLDDDAAMLLIRRS